MCMTVSSIPLPGVFLIENLHIIGSPFYFDEFFILVHNLQEKNPGNGMEDTVIHIFNHFQNNIRSISSGTNNCHDLLIMENSRSNLEKLPCLQKKLQAFPVNVQLN